MATPKLHAPRFVLAACLALGAALAPVMVHAQQPSADEQEARGLFELGSEAYAQARYERALKYFEEAYALSKRPGLQYNLGLTLSNLRRDREAIDAFERYLAELPDAENRQAVQNRIDLLKKNLGPATPAPPPAPVAPTPEEAARAQAASEPAPSLAVRKSDGVPVDEPSGGVHTKWWFWAGVGGAVVAGVLIGVVASGDTRVVEGPALLDDMTRVREL